MSTVAVLTEVRLLRDRNGMIWGRSEFGAERFEIYRAVYDGVVLIARVEPGDPAGQGLVPVENDWLRVRAIPGYSSVLGLVRQGRAINRVVWQALEPGDSLVVRLPTTSGAVLYPRLRRQRRPYGVEVLGDPGEFGRTVVDHPLIPLLSRYSVATMRRFIRHARTAVYVTQQTLQQRFPAPPTTLSVGVSDSVIPEQWFADPDSIQAPSGPIYKVVSVVSLEQPYKGIPTLMEATRILRDKGRQVQVQVVGDGRLRAGYEREAQQTRDLGDAFRFEGQQPAPRVRDLLGQADLFVLASMTEGLPKVLVEAMAAGLPCVATRVGGIPELLVAEDLVEPEDPRALAERIWEVLSVRARYEAAAHRNLRVARALVADDVQAERDRALLTLQKATEQWSRGF